MNRLKHMNENCDKMKRERWMDQKSKKIKVQETRSQDPGVLSDPDPFFQKGRIPIRLNVYIQNPWQIRFFSQYYWLEQPDTIFPDPATLIGSDERIVLNHPAVAL